MSGLLFFLLNIIQVNQALTSLVYLVFLVCLVSLVFLVEKHLVIKSLSHYVIVKIIKSGDSEPNPLD